MSTASPTPIRLFFALDARSQASPLLAIQQQWLRDSANPESISKPSPVSAENLHLTLLFLGNQPMSQIPLLSQQAERVVDAQATAPFAIQLDHLGLFAKAKVAWMAPSQPPEPLLRLEAELRAALAAVGIGVEDRPYRPHVTLLRKATRLLAGTVTPITLQATALHLYESRSTPDGVRYIQLASWDFAPPVFSKRPVIDESGPSVAG